MKGGVKFYRGAAGAARNYVEADRSRADDYYLAEGTGLAQRYSVTGEGAVSRHADLDGDGYEAWVAGLDPDTGEPRGQLGKSAQSVRFAEVVVNGPKSWSLAAELHPDIAAVYAAAQDRAAEQIVAWMGQHATTRVGPRGGQVSTPVEHLEAVSVRHYTSRAGDPHRHLHVQVNARVFAAEKWRGIDTVAVRNSIEAVHGIGHAAVMCDLGFREALAGHGFTLDPQTGEVVEIAPYVGAFSKRAEQIGAQIDGYEAEWRAAHPDSEPGPALRRSWDARAWAEHRPGKVPDGGIETAEDAHGRWVGELRALGYRDPARPVAIVPTPVGQLDRDAAAAELVDRLTATRSAWNHPDLRGEADQYIARAGVVVDPAARTELAEDLAARAASLCVPLLVDEHGAARDVPDHLRAWTSPHAIAVEDDITGRLAVRGSLPGADATVEDLARATEQLGTQLDPAQAEAAAALAGDHALVLVTGAAGAGKTTTLAAARAVLEHDGHQVHIVAPTLKAARTAQRETGADAASAHKLAHEHGWRWTSYGAWTRLQDGDVDERVDRDTGEITHGVYGGPSPAGRLRRGDLLVVDEAGMLDQDTARALLHAADEAGARIALVGDPHQLAAIGRGGVLDLAGRWAERAVMLDVIHRFTCTVEIEPGVYADVPDDDYAALSLRLRDGQNPDASFDELHAAGHVHLHTSSEELRKHVATEAVAARGAGHPIAIAAATNAEVRALNAAIRAQLVDGGAVDDHLVATTAAGERIGAGDQVATRSNDHDTDVANRDLWTVTAVYRDGSIAVVPAGDPARVGEQPRQLTAGYVAEHVELAYAATVHGVQGETAHAGHLVLDEHTGAGAAYVGMTRGRTANTVHTVVGEDRTAAEALDEARQQWIDAAGRDRTDLGIADARQQADAAAAQYAGTGTRPDSDRPAPELALPKSGPPADPARLADVLEALRAAWTAQANAAAQVDRLEPRLAAAQADAERVAARDARLAALRQHVDETRAAAAAAAGPAEQARAQLTAHADRLVEAWRQSWNLDREPAGDAARNAQAGPGRFGRITGGRDAVAANRAFLQEWVTKWRPIVPDLVDVDAAIVFAARHPGHDRIDEAVHDYVADRVREQRPDLVHDAHQGAQTAQDASAALDAYTEARRAERLDDARLWAGTGWRDLAEELPELTDRTIAARAALEHADQRLDQLAGDPAVTAQPDPAGWLAGARDQWSADRDSALAAAASRAAVHADRENAAAARQRMHQHEHDQPGYGHDAGREGPGIGR